MCGRYASSRSPEDLVEDFDIEFTSGPGPGEDPAQGQGPDFNVAPSRSVPVVLERAPRTAVATADAEVDDVPAATADADGDPTADAVLEAGPDPAPEPVRWLRLLHWGLVPSWAKDRSVGYRMINARAETLLDRTFKRAALSRRCLVPADGWYEWQRSPTERDARGRPRKQPFYLSPVAGGPIAFAGVYEFWRDVSAHPDDETDEEAGWLTSFSIVTTEAEPGLSAVHDRMPLVLPPERWDDWLDPALTEPDAVRALLAPPIAGRFCAVPVSTRVNSVANNGPELREEVPADQLRGVLDPATGELIGGGDVALF